MEKEKQNRLTFEEHDQLDREHYADFLIQLAQSAECDEGSYTIAVNAEYGRGKTTLLKMMVSKIRKVYSSRPKPLFITYYNAWQYDFFNEPLTPLTMSLFDNPALKGRKYYRRITNSLTQITQFVASLSNDIAVKVTGINVKDALDSLNIISKTEEDFLEYKNAIMYLEKALAKAIGLYGPNAKMIVVIDELDRCKPDFAIKTLEITKHLLANKSIVFLFALDMGQLQKAVEHAYGNGMDSTGYLLRFFDYISNIPEPKIDEYIWNRIRDIEEQPFADSVALEFVRCSSYFHMTLRDIDRIIAVYRYMYKYFIREYKNPIAHMLYIHLICLKYKRREWFESIINPDINSHVEFTDRYKDIGNESDSIAYRINRLSGNKNISMVIDQQNHLFFKDQVFLEVYDSKGVIVNRVRVFSERKDMMIAFTKSDGIPVSPHRMRDDLILGYVLFPEDLQRYKSIKARTIVGYIHQHMEFFDFETGLIETSDKKDESKNDAILVKFPTPGKK